MSKKIGTAARLLAVAALGAGLAVAGGSPAAAATGITVDPSTGLSHGQSVTVAGTGFAASTNVRLVQCNSTFTSCDAAGSIATTTDADGAVSSPFVVHATYAGVNPQTREPAGDVDCAVVQCVIAIAESPTVSAVQPISFG